jgi:hypothetical protein
MENFDFVIYEWEKEIGGTWWLNRYPGYVNIGSCGYGVYLILCLSRISLISLRGAPSSQPMAQS